MRPVLHMSEYRRDHVVLDALKLDDNLLDYGPETGSSPHPITVKPFAEFFLEADALV